MQISQAQFDRTVRTLREYAGEPARVELIKSAFYLFGSELATYRLIDKYKGAKAAHRGYSETYQSHYVALEVSDLEGEMSAPAEAPTREQCIERANAAAADLVKTLEYGRMRLSDLDPKLFAALTKALVIGATDTVAAAPAAAAARRVR